LNVTVVIPARNMASTIGAQLAALSAQTYGGGWDLVVVDDGSTDRTAGVAKRWTHRLPDLRVITGSRPHSPGHARNLGVDATACDAVVFCDADDIVGAEWLRAMVGALQDHDLVTGPLEHRLLNPLHIATLMSDVGSHAAPVAYGFLPYAFGGNLGVSRSLFDAVAGFRPDFRTGEDLEFSWRAQLAGAHLHFAPGATVHRRWPQTLGHLTRREARYASEAPRLYRDYARNGMPPSPSVWALGDWVVLALRSPELAVPGRRGPWCMRVGHRAGRLAGSARWRTAYL